LSLKPAFKIRTALNKYDQYYLDALYKQVKEGNAPTDNSSITDLDELGIWNEWNKL
jgi:hypothetical protein